jgi:radical SAM superfamily enzyme YgiQ (UPF0313 family)
MTTNPLRIFLCDLTHDSIVLVSDTIPINVGFIGAYAKKALGDAIDVSLFKYPQTAIDAIIESPPDIIALSNYSWNSNLSNHLAAVAKQANPKVVTVQGGTNFPHTPDQQLDYLISRPATDIHTVLEGETAFLNIARRVLAARYGEMEIFEAPIDGTVFVDPASRHSANPVLIQGAQPTRIRSLDDIPSPYLTGLLDGFIDGRLTPFLETNRGCPFKCSFCHTGADYFQKINMFSTERVRAEINYLAPKMAEHGIVNLHIADTNFGMYPRDREICEALHEAQENYGWPLQVIATTGKNNKERVIEITSILGKMFSVNMSVQSMSPQVLSNIRRSNIKLEHYIHVNDHLRTQGRATKAELIIGLPGETRDSFVQGIERVIEAGVSSTTIYTLMLLHGTEFKDPSYRDKFGIKGKYRIVPLNFGEYGGTKVFDCEEVGVENKDMSFDDYIYLRRFALLVEALLNGRPFDEFFRYAGLLGENPPTFLKRIHDNIDQAPEKIRDVMDAFLSETRSELWNSEDELVAHYQKKENYEQLARGEVGGNLIYKYKSQSVAFTPTEWIGFLASQLNMLAESTLDDSDLRQKTFVEIEAISAFCRNKVAGLLNAEADTTPIEEDFDFHIAAWLHDADDVPLSRYASSEPIRYVFEFTDEQLQTRNDQFKRYGTDVNALSKIVTRISNLESLFRKISPLNGEAFVRLEPEDDQLTRYALSN